MAIKPPLTELNVLVTRPAQQSKILCKLIHQAGGQAIAFPVIDIVPTPAQQWSNLSFKPHDTIIFISRNAVVNFVKGLAADLPSGLQLVAIGDGTANSMISHGLRVDLQPNKLAGSEGLLALPEFKNSHGKNIFIVRGKGGRGLLADSLSARGANIRYIEVYQRVLATPSVVQCQQALDADCVVCTSVMGVNNLTVLLQNGITSLLAKPLIVVSERIKDHALSLGFQRVAVSSAINDDAILTELIKMEI